MTSTVRYFRHDDPGAPTLTGEVGSLTNLLRKCLVGTAGVAYGSKPSAGWTEEFVGAAANIAVFKNNEDEGGCGCYVRVNDNAPPADGACTAEVTIYGHMTAVDTGTLGSSAVYHKKSWTLNATPRPWLVIADGRTAWVFTVDTGGNKGGGGDANSVSLVGFGDIDSFLPAANTNRYFLLGNIIPAPQWGGFIPALSLTGMTAGSLCVALPNGGVVDSGYLGRPWMNGGTYGIGGSSSAVAAGVAGSYLLMRGAVIFAGASSAPVGRIRGLLLPLSSLTDIPAGGEMVGSGVVVKGGANGDGNYSSDYTFRVAIDHVGPW